MTKEAYLSIKRNIKILDIVRLEHGLDKTGIAQKMGVTWPTISSYVEELQKYNILVREDSVLKINSNYGYFFGISVGSAQTKICLVDMNLHIVDTEKFAGIIEGDNIFDDQKRYMKDINKPIQQYLCSETSTDSQTLIKNINSIFASIINIIDCRKEINIMGIGIAFTGAIDRARKKIIKAFNLPCLDETDFEEGILLRNHLDFFEERGIKVSLENNSTATGIAEKWALYDEETLDGKFNINQKYKNCKNIISVYLGAGLGLGIIQDNKVYRGSNDLCGSAGHLEVPQYVKIKKDSGVDMACTCGGQSCLDYRIRTDVFETTFNDFRKWESDYINNFLVSRPDKKDLLGKYLGYLINLLNNLLNPDLIIISGKLHIAIDELWEAIQEKRNENNLKYTKSNCALIKSQLGLISAAIGAAICAYYDKFDADIGWDY